MATVIVFSFTILTILQASDYPEYTSIAVFFMILTTVLTLITCIMTVTEKVKARRLRDERDSLRRDYTGMWHDIDQYSGEDCAKVWQRILDLNKRIKEILK
jgi:hypothetical protein